jgi:hypothetical protein
VHNLCVLKGDVQGYGSLMHAGSDGPVRQALAQAVRQWARNAVFAEAGGGDSVLIVHDDPVALAQVCHARGAARIARADLGHGGIPPGAS